MSDVTLENNELNMNDLWTKSKSLSDYLEAEKLLRGKFTKLLTKKLL